MTTIPSVPINPTITFKELVPPKNEVTLNGHTYEITKIRQRVGGKEGEWVEVEFGDLTIEEQDLFLGSIRKSAELFKRLNTPEGLQSAHSLTFRFFQPGQTGPGAFRLLASKVSDRFAWKPEPIRPTEIAYRESEEAKEKTFKLNIEGYEEKDQASMTEAFASLISNIQVVERNHFSKKYRKKLREEEPEVTRTEQKKQENQAENIRNFKEEEEVSLSRKNA